MNKTTTHKRTWTFAALIAFFAVLIGMAQPSKATQPQVQLTKKEVKALSAGAKTPEDHMKVAAYFNQKADQLEAESREHEALAGKYRE
jgi:DNA-binding transcriptional regulator GbsR (MarR family)